MSMEFPEPYTAGQATGFEPLPPGEYVAQAIEGRIAPPKTGNGHALTLVWKILEGEHENRQVWQNIAIVHPKAGAQFHGQKMLDSIIAATGCEKTLKNVQPLLFVPVRLGITIETDNTGAYPDKNKVVKVLPFASETAEAPQPKSAPAQPAANPAAAARPTGSAPWHK